MVIRMMVLAVAMFCLGGVLGADECRERYNFYRVSSKKVWQFDTAMCHQCTSGRCRTADPVVPGTCTIADFPLNVTEFAGSALCDTDGYSFVEGQPTGMGTMLGPTPMLTRAKCKK